MENRTLDLPRKKYISNFGTVVSETEEYLSLDNLGLLEQGHENVKQIQREYDMIRINYQKLHNLYESSSSRLFNTVKLREQNENLQYDIKTLKPRLLMLEQQLLLEASSSDQHNFKGAKLQNDHPDLSSKQLLFNKTHHIKKCETLQGPQTIVNKGTTLVWDNKAHPHLYTDTKQLNEKSESDMDCSGISFNMKQLSEYLHQLEFEPTKRTITKMYEKIALELFKKCTEKEKRYVQIVRQKLKDQMEKYRRSEEKIGLKKKWVSKLKKNLNKEILDTTSKYSTQAVQTLYEWGERPGHLNKFLENKRKEFKNTTSRFEKAEVIMASQEIQLENIVKNENIDLPNTKYSLLYDDEAQMTIKNYQNEIDKKRKMQKDIEACFDDKQICSHKLHDNLYETKSRVIADLLKVLNEKWKVFREVKLALEGSIVCLVLYEEWLGKNVYKCETTSNIFFPLTRSSSDKTNIGCFQLTVENCACPKRTMMTRINQKMRRLRSYDENRRNI